MSAPADEHPSFADSGGSRVAIAGGGPVGASLAVALARAGVPVTVIEARDLAGGSHGDRDVRPIAISQGSRRILGSLGLWSSLARFATPIVQIHVSDRGRFGFARLRAGDFPVDALGYVVDAAALGRVLHEALVAQPGVKVMSPATIHGVVVVQDAAHLLVGAADTVAPEPRATELLVVSDGGHSNLRTLLGIDARVRDYGQSAITAVVKPRRAHAGIAYERFTTSGPLALLPMGEDSCGLVWSMPTARAETLATLGDDDFLHALGAEFGTRLGGFVQCGPRTTFPLSLITSERVVGERVAIIGNAANHLHPVAGQGLNLGLRDVAALAEIVAGSVRDGGDPGSHAGLARYAAWRRRDQRLITGATDTLVRLFSTPFAPLAAARDGALLALDLCPPVKRRFGLHAMGLAGRQGRLTRGLPL
jgi:2-octaprenyl-6-methoxyphenol hydroxylase